MNGIAQVIGCLLMYGIGKNTGLSLAPWRTLFLVCGFVKDFAARLSMDRIYAHKNIFQAG